MLEKFKEFIRLRAKSIEAEKPGTLAFLAYLNEDVSEVTTVQLFPDAEAMDRHMEGVGERSEKAAEFLEFKRRVVYGTPSERVQVVMKKAAGEGVFQVFVPQLLGGYLRLNPR